MPYCSNWGEPVDEDDSYCSNCGNALDGYSPGGQDIYIHTKVRCDRCDGTGKVDPPPINRVFGIKWTCPDCNGKGWIWE